MQRLGKVMHLSVSKNLILKAESLTDIGATVTDNNLRKIGKVGDVFGNVEAPYISVRLNVKDPEKYVGQVLYTLEA